MATPIGSFSGLASGIQWRDMVDQIMQLEESRRLSPVQTQLSGLESRQKAWSTYSGLVTKLNQSALKLRDGAAFKKFLSTPAKSPAGESLFTATASASAQPGSYRLEVIDLARAEKLNATERDSTSSAIGISGEFFVNGRRVDLVATDSLVSVRDKINAVNAGTSASGVTATILSTSPTSHRLILTATNTGSRGIELVDGATDALQSLGIVGATQSRNASPLNSANTDSQRFRSSTTSLASMLGVSPAPAVTTIKIGGQKINVDLSTDTMITILNRLTDAGGSGSIVEETIAGTAQYRLSVAGAVTADTDPGADAAASQRIVELLGFVQDDKVAQITSGQDSKARIDGFTVTRRTNTISDAISGVTLDLLAANGDERAASVTGAGLAVVTDPDTISAGTYGISLTASSTPTQNATDDSANLALAAHPAGLPDGTYAVDLVTTTTRSTSTSTALLDSLVVPAATPAGSYAVNITQVATRSSVTGAVAAAPYTGSTGDTMTVSAGGISRSYALTAGESLDAVVAGLNNMFTTNGMAMTASNVGGSLKLTQNDYGSAPSFTVTNNHNRVATAYGVGSTAGTSYQNGVNVVGTIGGYAATGTGRTLTADAGTAVAGLQVAYVGASVGTVGSVNVVDTTAVTDGTIGGQAATWNAATNRLTVDAGGSLAGLAMTYTGAAVAGTAGNVTLATNPVWTAITGASIGGVAAVWDDATKTISGAAGTAFEGVKLTYSGAPTSGSIGSLVVAGEIAADLTISRDLDASVADVQAFASAYNAIVTFADSQRNQTAGLQFSASLRSMVGSLKNVLLTDVPGLSADATPYLRGTQVGVSLSKTGQLEVDATVLKAAMATNLPGVLNLFSAGGVATDGEVTYATSTAASKPGSYAVSITAAATKATHTGSDRGAGFTYTASDGVSDTLSITDAHSGATAAYVVRQGEDLDTIVSELNTAFGNASMALTAERVGDALRIGSTHFGSAPSFTLAGAEANTRLGFTAGTYAGVDVQGTIGGFAATGVGQLLTGATGFDTEGLAITYVGTVAKASAGSVRLSRGLAGEMNATAELQSRLGDGSIVLQTDVLARSIDTLNDRVSNIQSRLETRREALIKQFTAMEAALARFQSQSGSLAAQLSSLTAQTKR